MKVQGFVADSANSAAFAVVLDPVDVIVEQFALQTVIRAKQQPAVGATLVNLLGMVAARANDFTNGCPVQDMVFGIVVAKSTSIYFLATRGLEKQAKKSGYRLKKELTF